MIGIKHHGAERRLVRRRAALPLLAALLLTAGARMQDNRNPAPQAPATASDYAPITLHVACGELFDGACGKVLPRISVRAAPTGVILQPVQSGGALDTVATVCQGQAAAAIVPADALALLARNPTCLGRYDVVGRPLYPLYAFLVARADAAFRSLGDVAGDGRRWTIAAGPDGSGGQITFGVLLRANASWERAVAVTNDDAASALDRLARGSIDGFFTVESLDSALLNRVRVGTDTRGEPLYRFIDLRPAMEFPRAADGRCLYRLTALDFGAASPVTTVSVDAVMILGRGFREAHARGGPFAPAALASAIDAARTAILADMKSPGDWRPAGTSCQ